VKKQIPGSNVFAVQLNIEWEDKVANFSKFRAALASNPPIAGSLVALPEMFATGYSMNVAATSQGIAREDETFLAEPAREYGVFVVGGVVSPGTEGMSRNDAVVFSPEGGLLARYTKIHPFSLSGEAKVHKAGTDIVVFNWSGFIVAPFVCYDLRFPEVFRSAARSGAGLFVVIALWPVKRQQHWLTLLQARAIENQAYVVGVNRVGTEPGYSYAGRSVVVDPHGVIIADAGEGENVLAAVVDPETVASWRREFPALSDMHWRETVP
jgi:predicted amidohydrolase